jgi:hypothetical protein
MQLSFPEERQSLRGFGELLGKILAAHHKNGQKNITAQENNEYSSHKRHPVSVGKSIRAAESGPDLG